MLPANGIGVATDRLYFGDDAAFDEEVYVCIQDTILTADDRPEEGANWETYFRKVSSRFRQHTALPAPSTIPLRDIGKVHLIRSAYNAAISLMAHLAPVSDATVGEWTAERDGTTVGHWGSRGHLTGYLNITRLDEVDAGGGTRRIEMRVADTGTIPSENTGRGIYFREHGSSGAWKSIGVTAGADGIYESLAFDEADSLIDEHTTYDLVVTSTGTGEAHGHEFADPPADNRYDFFPGSVKWAIVAERDDTDQNRVFIRELIRDPMIPDAPAGAGSARRILIGENGAYSLVNVIPEFMIPASIARDSEINAPAIRALLGLTEAEQNDLLTGVSISNGVLTFPQNDGTNVRITLPAATGTADNELQVASSTTFSVGAVRLSSVVVKHLALGDIVSFEIPNNIGDGAGDLVFRTSDGSTFSSNYNVLDRNGDNLTPADFEPGQRVFLQRISGFDMAVVSSAAATAPGVADGVVTGAVFNDAGTTFTITVETDGVESMISVPVPASLRSGGGGTASGGGTGTIGPSIGTFVKSLAYTQNIIQATDIPVPSADDGDALLIQYLGEDGVTDFTLVPIQQILDVPTASAQSDAVAAEAPDRNVVRTGWGQNDWIYIGVSSVTAGVGGGNLRLALNSSTSLYDDGTFDFRVVTFGDSTGGVVDVSDTHHPPTATASTIRNVYKDSSHNPPKVWIGYQRYEHTTAPAITSALQAAGAAGYRGVHYQAPTASAAGDWFWSREGHSWKYRAEGRFHNIGFSELKRVAMNAAGDALFFNATDVFLNEVQSEAQAAEIIENDGYEADKRYFFIRSSGLRLVATFAAGVGVADLYDFYELGELAQPRNPVGDNTIVAVAASQLVATDIDKPGTTWAWFNPGAPYGQWVRVLVADIPDDGEAETDVSADATKALSFPLDSSAEWFLAANAAGKITTGGSDATKFPTNLQMRTD